MRIIFLNESEMRKSLVKERIKHMHNIIYAGIVGCAAVTLIGTFASTGPFFRNEARGRDWGVLALSLLGAVFGLMSSLPA